MSDVEERFAATREALGEAQRAYDDALMAAAEKCEKAAAETAEAPLGAMPSPIVDRHALSADLGRAFDAYEQAWEAHSAAGRALSDARKEVAQ